MKTFLRIGILLLIVSAVFGQLARPKALSGFGTGVVQSSSPAFEPTDPILLSTGSPTKDEDPSVLRANDGSLYVAWFSDRGGN
ncbi:MAG TPA: hypothetical protein VFV34_14130, partial [Blastocatellia bacterium]|nr:hypothetical protein [Blastocatellia bacterium]